jgi:hypothetical protein
MPFISSIRKKYETAPTKSILDHLEITGGDEIYTAGGYRIHLFTKTGDSVLKINTAKNINADTHQHLITEGAVDIEYLVIAGGGGGATNLAGGGGAGGYREGTLSLTVGSTTPTSVGAGGAPSAPGSRYAVGNDGTASSFGPISTTGGGGGGNYSGGTGRNGGSGGGGGGGGGHHAGGGGGGAGARGWEAPQPGGTGGQYGNGIIGQGHPGGRGGVRIHTAGQGGSGLSSTITGNSVVRGGGGGGSGYPSSPSVNRGHPGGAGGGGTGRQTDIALNGETGATNTGGGGGSGSHYAYHGGGGGPGIVVVRYRI